MAPPEGTSHSIPLFVVVCTRYHKAIGVYLNPREALEVAQRMTAEDKECEYVPLPFMVESGELTRTPIQEPNPRGYL